MPRFSPARRGSFIPLFSLKSEWRRYAMMLQRSSGGRVVLCRYCSHICECQKSLSSHILQHERSDEIKAEDLVRKSYRASPRNFSAEQHQPRRLVGMLGPKTAWRRLLSGGEE